MTRQRSGVALLEVVAAVAILGVAAVVLTSIAQGSLIALARAEARDEERRQARALLEAMFLWSPDDLDRHLGRREQGRWIMQIDRMNDALYGITLRDSLENAIIATFLYRRRAFDVTDAR